MTTGETAGLVIVEDIFVEVVGEIDNEDDDYEAVVQFIKKKQDGKFLVEGEEDLEKVDQALGMHVDEDELGDMERYQASSVRTWGVFPRWVTGGYSIISGSTLLTRTIKGSLVCERRYCLRKRWRRAQKAIQL